MKMLTFVLLIILASSCVPSRPAEDELSGSNVGELPPAWTSTPVPPTRTPSPPSVIPSPTTTPLPIEGCIPRFISSNIVPGKVPSLSSDGQTFVYLCGSADDASICLMGKDGGNPRVISGETRNLVDPQWSPTDEIIAFVQTTSLSLHENNPPISDICLSSPGGDLLYQVTDNPTMMNNTIEEIQWSTDGKRIAFSTGGFAGSVAHDIYVINSDGSGLRRLSFPPALNYSPRWSPDGRQLVYYSMSVEGIAYLVIVSINEDWKPETRIPLPIGGDLSWSPDGRFILYSDRGLYPDLSGDYDLHIYDLIHGKDYSLTTGEAIDFQPIWSKDGTVIVFTSNLDGNYDLYSMRKDGSGVNRQVDNLSDAFIHNPIWANDGKTIYFFLSGGRKDIYEMWAVDLVEYCE